MTAHGGIGSATQWCVTAYLPDSRRNLPAAFAAPRRARMHSGKPQSHHLEHRNPSLPSFCAMSAISEYLSDMAGDHLKPIAMRL